MSYVNDGRGSETRARRECKFPLLFCVERNRPCAFKFLANTRRVSHLLAPMISAKLRRPSCAWRGGKRGAGTHASLSRFDMHNTLVANGPSFRRGYLDQFPSGNADVTSTILALLGLREWKQYLKTTTFGGGLYIDEGSGQSTQK